MTEPTVTVNIDLSSLKEFGNRINDELQGTDGPIQAALRQWAARYRAFVQQRFSTYSRGGGDWAPLSDRRKKERRKKSGKELPKWKPKKFKPPVNNRTQKPQERSGKTRRLRNQIKKTGLIGKGKTLSKKFKNTVKAFKKRRKLQKRLERHQKGNRGALIARKKAIFKGREAKRKKAFMDRRAKMMGKMRFAILRDTGILFTALSPAFIGAPGQLEITIPFGIRVGYGGSANHGQDNATVTEIAEAHQNGNKSTNLPKREIIVAPPQEILDKMAGDMTRALKKLAKDIGGGDDAGIIDPDANSPF